MFFLCNVVHRDLHFFDHDDLLLVLAPAGAADALGSTGAAVCATAGAAKIVPDSIVAISVFENPIIHPSTIFDPIDTPGARGPWDRSVASIHPLF